MRESLLPFVLLLLAGCGSEASSSPSDIDGLGPNASLAPLFTVSAPRNGEDLTIDGSVYSGTQTQDIPQGRLVVVTGAARTPLTRKVERYDDENHVVYNGAFPAAADTTVSLVLVRKTDHVVATTKLPAPASFSLVDPPATIGDGAKLTVELSRPLAADETAMLLVRGACFAPKIVRDPTVTGTRAVFAPGDLAPFEACEATLDLQINRVGTIDAAFGRAFQLRAGTTMEARFEANRLGAAQSKINVAPRK